MGLQALIVHLGFVDAGLRCFGFFKRRGGFRLRETWLGRLQAGVGQLGDYF